MTVSATTMKQLDPTQVELEIPISPEEFAKAQDAAFRKLARSAKLPGFRPGKVPRKIFENTYGIGAIMDRALEDLVPEKYAEAVKEHAIEPLARPEMEMLPEEEGQPMRFKAVVAVRPPIEPAPYEGIEVEDVPEKAGDDDMDQRARNDAQRTPRPSFRSNGRSSSATRPRSTTPARSTASPSTAAPPTGQQAEISEERFIPGFASGIVGMKAGETQDINAKFPDEYGATELAGKDATFTITVHEIKEPELPATRRRVRQARLTAPDPRRAQRRTAHAARRRRRPKGAPPDQHRAARQARCRQRFPVACGAGRARDRRAAR